MFEIGREQQLTGSVTSTGSDASKVALAEVVKTLEKFGA
jgi:Leu/Phe-tRNA-protein transferase